MTPKDSEDMLDSLSVLEALTERLVNTYPEDSLYKESLDLLPLGVAIISSRIVTWGNKKILSLLGYESVDEIVGKSTLDFYISRTEYERAGSECYPSGQTLARMRMKDGTEKLIFLRVMEHNIKNGRALVTFCSLESLKRLCSNFGGGC
jgi:hypothetical protein